MSDKKYYGDEFVPELSPLEEMQRDQEYLHEEIRSGIKWVLFFVVLYFINK